MRNKTIIWLITAAVMLLLGSALFIGAIIAAGDLTNLSTTRYETITHTVTEDFQSLSFETRRADMTILRAEDDICRVVCKESEKETFTVSAEDGVLTVRETNLKKWYDHIGIDGDAPAITVYLPGAAYDRLTVHSVTGDLHVASHAAFAHMDCEVATGDVTCHDAVSGQIKINTSTGDIRIVGGAPEMLDLTVTTGDITLADIHPENLRVVVNSGSISLRDVTVSARLCLQSTSGDIELDRCDAAELFIKTTSGDVEGSLLSDKVFITKTSTGDIEIPRTGEGGTCEIITTTGDIEIEIVG